MKTKSSFDYASASLAAIATASAILLSACGQNDTENTNSAVTPSQTVAAKPRAVVPSASLGEVRSVEAITEKPKGSGAGAVAGGVLGGVLGHQVGDGNGQKAATVVGAVGGAVLGNAAEKKYREKIVGYRVEVRMDNGDVRSFQESDASLRVGDRVRVESGQLRRV